MFHAGVECAFGIADGRERNLEGRAVHGVEPELRAHLLREASDEQPCARHQHERSRELTHDQRAARLARNAPRARAASAAPQRGHQIRTTAKEQGEDAHRDRRDDHDAERRRGETRVERELRGARQLACAIRAQQPDPRASRRDTGRAARGHEQHDFGHHLSREAESRGAQRHSHGELASPYLEAREEELRGVHARNQEHERHAADEAHEHLRHVAHHLPAQRHEQCARVGVLHHGNRAFDHGHHSIHVLARRKMRCSRPEAPHYRQVRNPFRWGLERDPQLRHRRELKVTRHLRPARKREPCAGDTYDGVQLAVQREHSADDAHVRAEPAPP